MLDSETAWVVLPRRRMYYIGSVEGNRVCGKGTATWEVLDRKGPLQVVAKGNWGKEGIEVKLKF